MQEKTSALIEYYEKALNVKPSHPIDLDAGEFICKLINDRYIFRMLEIGSGIGFSANYFALNSNLTSIVSIEKEFGFYLKSKIMKLSNKIEFIWKDFLEYESKTKYPLIFLDASKSNQIELFKKAETFLKSKGLIIVDNIFMNRIRHKDNKNAIKLLEKVDAFKEYLLALENYDVKIENVGDGLVICQKKD